MDEHDISVIEKRLREAALAFEYPPVPDIARRVTRRLADQPPAVRRSVRRPALGVALALGLVLLALLAVPSVRAAVLEFFQFGAIRIFTNPTETPVEPYQTLPSLLDLAGETTLAEAQEQSGLPIRLPAYPPDLGEPDRVFMQQVGGPVVVLLWTAPQAPQQIRLSLMILGPGSFADKGEPPEIEMTRVNNNEALWMQGSHSLFLSQTGDTQPTRIFVESNVLVWMDDGVTYRIESNDSLEEAVRIAESLR